MFSLRGLLTARHLALLLLYSQVNVQASSELDISSRNWTMPLPDHNKIHVFNMAFANKEDGTSFMECQRWTPGSRQLCDVTMLTWPAPNVTKRSTCRDIDVSNGDETSNFPGLWPFNPDRVVILVNARVRNSSETNDTEPTDVAVFTIVDMANCDVVARLRIPTVHNDTEDFTSMVAYRERFDFVGYSEDKCGDQLKKCRITYDLEGQRIGEPKPYDAPTSLLVMHVAHQTLDGGNYLVTQNLESLGRGDETTWTVSYVEASSGRDKVLATDIDAFPKGTDLFSWSDAHGLFSVCWLHPADYSYNPVTSRQVRCCQFDTQVMRMNLTLTLPHNTTWVAAHNLADGELLVATGNCWIDNRVKHCKGLQVQRIAADGQKRYTASETRMYFKYRDIFRAWITENSEQKFCFSLNWLREMQESMDWTHQRYCLPMKDILQPPAVEELSK